MCFSGFMIQIMGGTQCEASVQEANRCLSLKQVLDANASAEPAKRMSSDFFDVFWLRDEGNGKEKAGRWQT